MKHTTMDQSQSESDVSLSPSQILDRLQVLRKIQLLQRGKLQKHLQYQNSPEVSSSITEIVSHFSNSTSYNTFRTLLNSTQDSPIGTPLVNINRSQYKENFENVVEGVSVLNLSEESEFIANSVSPRSLASAKKDFEEDNLPQNITRQSLSKKHISLDEMPILSPKKDFETLIKEKLQDDKSVSNVPQAGPQIKKTNKRPFLRKGEGTARFGIKKNDLVIQNTKSLPWKNRKLGQKSVPKIKINNKSPEKANVNIQIKDKPKGSTEQNISPNNVIKKLDTKNTLAGTKQVSRGTVDDKEQTPASSTNNTLSSCKLDSIAINLPKGKHPFHNSKERTWASIFTKEQDDFLRQLKQSEYYKNFVSPAKSTVSDSSCIENNNQLRQNRELAEQNLFELIENKVTHESFSIDNSFFNRFLSNNNLECSGESTPLVMQKCLYKNPNLMHILPEVAQRTHKSSICSESETCNTDCQECSDNCSNVSSCCSCQTTQEISVNSCVKGKQIEKGKIEKVPLSKVPKKDDKSQEKNQNDNVIADNDIMNTNMAEMNAKLIATSELLKDRLRELEDEIETFRKENANLSKMREEVDLERHKFYEEKTAFEEKFNEEKILSEYYLAEEKEKLNKQKQMYERYVRDMRGRLSKKEKDEVINLKKEISDLRDEIRIKDAKSTSTIARLRNQLKIMEKDKKNLEDELEKLKKENKRIQHSNDITRRLTNLKYLEQINKKLTNMATKDSRSEIDLDSNVKYKAYEIERQSRVRKKNVVAKNTMKPRAKSVPNLQVTSRYAKYFSQKDSLSSKENNTILNDDPGVIDDFSDDNYKSDDNDSKISNNTDDEEENNLEKIYNERFKSISPQEMDYEKSNSPSKYNDDYFIKKSDRSLSQNSLNKNLNLNPDIRSSHQNLLSRTSKSPITFTGRLSNESRSTKSFGNDNCDYTNPYTQSVNRNKSPVSILSNRSSSSQKSGTVINKDVTDRLIPSPEPTSSKTSLTKTNLNPTELKMSDGTRELRFPNGNVKFISADGKYSKFIYYNGDIKENFYNEGRIKYYYAETKTYHTTHPDGLEVLEFPDGQVEKRYKDGSSEIRLPNGSIRYYDPKNEHVREEWRFPDGTALTVSANGEQRVVFPNGQVEVQAKDHRRREFPDGSVKLVYNDGTAETRYASGRVRIKDKHGNLIMDSAPG